MAEVFIVMLLFVVADLVTGLIASRKRMIPCNSRRLRKSVVKLVCYLSAVLLTFIAERVFALEWLGIYKFIGGFICFVELVSVLENMAAITEKPIFLKIIRIVRGRASEKYGEDVVDSIFNEKNDKQNDSKTI